jgi:hypothetical protein
MEQQKRTWLSPLEIVAVVLCLLYAGFLGFYIAVMQGALYSGFALIPVLAAILLLCGVRSVARILQWLVALGWGLLSLVLLGLTTQCWRSGPRSDFFTCLAMGLVAAGFAFLHSFIARHIRQRDEE